VTSVVEKPDETGVRERYGGAATGPSGLRPVVIGLIILAAATGVFAWALTWTTGPARLDTRAPLPAIAQVPEFSLIERSGEPVTNADLLGKVWIADFIFTRCGGPCPELSARMRSLQYAFADSPDVRLVSICLDPQNDTPAALQHYAKRFQADGDRWWFLTGTDDKYVHALVEKGFLQSVVPATGESPLLHSTYVVIVDRQGRIRAAHNGLDAGMQDAVLRDVNKLLAEPSGS